MHVNKFFLIDLARWGKCFCMGGRLGKGTRVVCGHAPLKISILVPYSAIAERSSLVTSETICKIKN